jgi:hypothetical protein
MDVLHKIWVNLWAPLSWQFTVAILLMMAIDLCTYYKNHGRKHRHLTGLMTGAGILGTFFGIVVGLQDFNPSKIQDSIGPLLEGMKVAFITSVMGIAAAIITELIEKLLPSPYAKTGDPVADSHHRDFNKANNSIFNLQALCIECHAKEHPENGSLNRSPDLKPFKKIFRYQ